MATGLKRYQQTRHAYLTTSNGSGATEKEFTSQPRDVESGLNSSTIQTMHDAGGNLVHYDPKN